MFRRDTKGVTLLELMIGISVLSLVVYASFSVYHWIADAERQSSYRQAMEDLRLEVMRTAFSENALELAITQREDGLSALNVNLAKCLINEGTPPVIPCPGQRFPVILFNKMGRLSGFGAEAPSEVARVLYRRNGSICPMGAVPDDLCTIEVSSSIRCVFPDCRVGDVDRPKKFEMTVKIEWLKPVPGMVIQPVEMVQPITLLQESERKDVAHISPSAEVPAVIALIKVPGPTTGADVPQNKTLAVLARVATNTPTITPVEIPHETPPPLNITKPEGQEPEECSVAAAPFGGGDGSEINPFKICSADHLQNVRTALKSQFILSSDIKLGGVAFHPIGQKTAPFAGRFYGNGRTIRDLTLVDSTGTEPLGLFAYIGDGALISKLKIAEASVSNQNAAAKNRCLGIAVGSVESAAELNDVFVSGRLSSGAGDSIVAGGLVGCANYVTIKRSRFEGELDSFTVKSPSIEAGWVGAISGKSSITDSTAQIDAIGTRAKSNVKLAGLVGEIRSKTVEIRKAILRNSTHQTLAAFASCANADPKLLSDVYVEASTDESTKPQAPCAGEIRLYACPDNQHLKTKMNCQGPLFQWSPEWKLPAFCPEKACWPSLP